MTKIAKVLDDVYYYRHPLNANCVVFAFMTGNGREFDLIDTGVMRLGIYRNLFKQMYKDGLDPSNVRNIYHGHYHFDHIQCDKLFQKKAKLNKGNVKIYVPESDAYRTKPDYNIIDTNMSYLYSYFGRNVNKSFPLMPYIGKYMMEPFFKFPLPDNILFYKDNEEFTIGQYKSVVITTGGHTEGHSFFHFPEINVLHTGDNNALNEFIVDFGAVARSMVICRELAPEMVFIGHNEPCKNKKESDKWTENWFKGYDVVLGALKPVLKNNVKINVTKIMKKMGGWAFKIELARFFGFMGLFVIMRHLEEKGYGKLVLEPDNVTLKFLTAPNIEDMELKLF